MVMTSNVVWFADHPASRLTRQAIRHEPRCPPGDPDAPAANKLLQVARRLAQKAAQGDVSAIKEALDRIDGKSLPGAPESDDRPTHVNVSWKKPK
jgi:hypothetical protein